MTFSDCPRRTSVNNGSTLLYDLMRIKAPTYCQPNIVSKVPLNRPSMASEHQINGTITH